MKNITDKVFILIWIIFAAIFARLVYDSHKSAETVLPRTSVRIPPSYNVQIGNVRFQDEINGLANDVNRGIEELESSIRQSGKTSKVVNLVSLFLCIAGAVAQFASMKTRCRPDIDMPSTKPNKLRIRKRGQPVMCAVLIL